MNKSRLLVAVSSPWSSEKLAKPIGDLAARPGARVLAAHVSLPQVEDEHERDARNRGEQTLRLFCESMASQGIEAEGLMLFSNDIPQALVDAGVANQCTMLVVGHRRRAWIRRLLEGDPAARIARLSPVPVLLCPETWDGGL